MNKITGSDKSWVSSIDLQVPGRRHQSYSCTRRSDFASPWHPEFQKVKPVISGCHHSPPVSCFCLHAQIHGNDKLSSCLRIAVSLWNCEPLADRHTGMELIDSCSGWLQRFIILIHERVLNVDEGILSCLCLCPCLGATLNSSSYLIYTLLHSYALLSSLTQVKSLAAL